MRTSNDNNNAPIDSSGKDKPKDEIVCRIYNNTVIKEGKSKGLKYLRLYMEGEKGPDGKALSHAVYKSKPREKQTVADYEYYNVQAKVVQIKANVLMKGDKESIKVEFFDETGKFQKSFIAYAVGAKTTAKTPDYVAYSNTVRTLDESGKTK